MKPKQCFALLIALCLFASPVLADGSSAKKKSSTPVSSKTKTVKSDDQVLSLIAEITNDVERADERLADVETRLVNLDNRVSTLETKQEETISQLIGFKQSQQAQIAQAQQLASELSTAHQKADQLTQQASQLAAEANSARGQAAQANQMAAQANQQAQQAWAHAQAADRAAQPKGPGKLLAAIFPRMLGHR